MGNAVKKKKLRCACAQLVDARTILQSSEKVYGYIDRQQSADKTEFEHNRRVYGSSRVFPLFAIEPRAHRPVKRERVGSTAASARSRQVAPKRVGGR